MTESITDPELSFTEPDNWMDVPAVANPEAELKLMPSIKIPPTDVAPVLLQPEMMILVEVGWIEQPEIETKPVIEPLPPWVVL